MKTLYTISDLTDIDLKPDKKRTNPSNITTYKASFFLQIHQFILLSMFITLAFHYSCNQSTNPPFDNNNCDDADSIGVWKFLGLENETVTAIAVNPQKPNIIFAGTGKDFSAGIPGRLYRSTDCGRTWQVLFEGIGFSQSVIQILFDPENSNIVYAIPHPILKSTDGGETWKDVSNGIRLDWETRISSIAIDPSNSNVLYAGTGGFFGGTLYKSTDKGNSWKNLYRNEEDTPGLRGGVISLAIDPTNSNIIYAGTAWNGVLVKSTDSGYTWKVTGLGETGRLIMNISIDYRATQKVYTGISHIGFMKSLDGGDTWHSFNNGLPDTVHGIKLIVNPANMELYGITSFNNDGWIYKNGNSESWTKFGINDVRCSYYYSDIFLIESRRYLFFGTKGGLYQIKLV